MVRTDGSVPFPFGKVGSGVLANLLVALRSLFPFRQAQYAKIKRVITKLATHFVCSRCRGITERMVDSIEKLTANRFCYLGDTLNASGGCEAAVTVRVKIGCVRFRECREFSLGTRFPLRMKGKVYRCCVKLAILYGSEAWCSK